MSADLETEAETEANYVKKQDLKIEKALAKESISLYEENQQKMAGEILERELEFESTMMDDMLPDEENVIWKTDWDLPVSAYKDEDSDGEHVHGQTYGERWFESIFGINANVARSESPENQ